MQLDAEEDGQPFYKAPQIVSATSNIETSQRPQTHDTEAQAAASTTAEQEE